MICKVLLFRVPAWLFNLYDACASQIVQRGLMTQADYDEASRKALSLFEYGQVN